MTTRKAEHSPKRRTGFTLVELLVVIAIGSVVMAITLGGYRSFATGNQRASCQTNLSQIYGAFRLYVSDYDGYAPLFDPDPNAAPNPFPASGGGANRHLGLWSLYVLPKNGTHNELADFGEQFPSGAIKPVGVYLRNYKQMHCPADVDNEERFVPGTNQFIPEYFSYQTLDDMGDADATNDQWTYLSYRGLVGTGTCPQLNPNATPPITAADRSLCRQLLRFQDVAGNLQRLQRTPDDATVITWCKWHRGSRPVDNVLFYDGVVRPVPKEQDHPSGTGTLIGWQRVP